MTNSLVMGKSNWLHWECDFECRKALIDAKYSIAGNCARLMFDLIYEAAREYQHLWCSSKDKSSATMTRFLPSSYDHDFTASSITVIWYQNKSTREKRECVLSVCFHPFHSFSLHFLVLIAWQAWGSKVMPILMDELNLELYEYLTEPQRKANKGWTRTRDKRI